MANTARFVSDNGNVYEFGTKGQTAFTMNFGDGISVEISTAQGFSQIGETIQNKRVRGRYIDVKGFIYANIEENKKKMRKAFAPFQSGTLFVNEKHYIQVSVKDSPSFSIMKKNGSFMMRLYSPYPYFKKVEKTTYNLPNIIPKFSFPVNYSTPHEFGEYDQKRFILAENNGSVSALFSSKIYAKEDCGDLTINNDTTGQFLRFNLEIKKGDLIESFYDENGIFNARLTSQSGIYDIIGSVDDKSEFFEIPIGKSAISILTGKNGKISAQISFEESVVSVFED